MKRNRPSKIKNPYGGCMSNPPEDCILNKFHFTDEETGVLWIDNLICIRNCTEYCKERIQHDEEMAQKWKESKKKKSEKAEIEAIKEELLKEA